MNGQRSSAYLDGLLHELSALPRETEWLEFKQSHGDPQEIGEYISALANSAALVGRAGFCPCSIPRSIFVFSA